MTIENNDEDVFPETVADFPEIGGVLRPGDAVSLRVESLHSGWRLDQFLAHFFPAYSRVYLRRVIGSGAIRIGRTGDAVVDAGTLGSGLANSLAAERGGKPAYRLKPGETVSLVLPELPRESPIPEAIPLSILYDDDRVAVVDKPPGMVVHPARGHWSGTLAGALQHHFGGRLSAMGGPTRPGIVHRLDRDTSGVILVAKDDLAHRCLTQQFADRTTEKEYVAVTVGAPHPDRDVVCEPIGPHPRNREQMAIRRDLPDALAAETWFEVNERFAGDGSRARFALITARPKTGRTHQIRIHLAHVGAPILCDRLYGHRAQITELELRGERTGGSSQPLVEPVLSRQALHARMLRFDHPGTGKRMEITAPLPMDMEHVLTILRGGRGER